MNQLKRAAANADNHRADILREIGDLRGGLNTYNKHEIHHQPLVYKSRDDRVTERYITGAKPSVSRTINFSDGGVIDSDSRFLTPKEPKDFQKSAVRFDIT